MVLDTTSDTHVHTSLCRHAVGSMEDYVVAAVKMGLRRLVFLEHMEEGIEYAPRTWLTEEDFDFYFEEGRRLQDRYGKQLEIGLGVEVGFNPDCADRLVKRLSRRKWDLIGLSYHFCRLPGEPLHLNMLSRKLKNLKIVEQYGPDRLLGQYLDTLIEGIQTIPARVLCHLDAGLRYQPGLRFSTKHLDQINRVLEAVKKADMLLEINTSGLQIRGKPFPQVDVINRAREMGIGLTVGSDAHKPSEVGRYFEKLPILLS